MQPAIERFEQARRSSVRTTVFDWNTIWKDLVNIGIYKRGADVSEVGTTWMGSLISMDALRAFKRTEISQIGGERAFLPAAWQSTSLVEDERVLAIPFASDVRVIFYWRDMLEKVGVDEATAFSSFEAMEDTLERLKSALPAPWAFATDTYTHNNLYTASTWVWGAGGDFISPDGKKTQLSTPEVRSALNAYFGLNRFLPRVGQPMNTEGALELFRQRQVATIMGGPWVLTNLRGQAQSAGLPPQLGVALPPGPSFVGGTNLVVWQHTRCLAECIELIRHLVSPQAQLEYCPVIGMMPVRMEALADPFYSADPYYKILAEALRQGRVSTSFPLWGVVEDRLSADFAQIWVELFNQPEESLDEILIRHLNLLTRRLDITLGG